MIELHDSGAYFRALLSSVDPEDEIKETRIVFSRAKNYSN